MKKLYAALLVVLAILSVIAAIVYFTHTAAQLPHFLPGYTAGLARKHTKHGLAFVSLAAVLLLIAWMVSGSKSSAPKGSGEVSSNENQNLSA